MALRRPELLPACVGVTAHPDDARHRALFGKFALTPLFRVPVPIFPSEKVDPEKGTGTLSGESIFESEAQVVVCKLKYKRTSTTPGKFLNCPV